MCLIINNSVAEIRRGRVKQHWEEGFHPILRIPGKGTGGCQPLVDSRPPEMSCTVLQSEQSQGAEYQDSSLLRLPFFGRVAE